MPNLQAQLIRKNKNSYHDGTFTFGISNGHSVWLKKEISKKIKNTQNFKFGAVKFTSLLAWLYKELYRKE
jgi:hypothetical protein